MQSRPAFCVAAITALAATLAAQSPAAVVPTHGESEPSARVTSAVHPASRPEQLLLSPAQVRHFYGFDGVTATGAGQTIAIIIAHHDPLLERDLAVFSQRFGLPQCTAAQGCLRQIPGPSIDASGKPRPAQDKEGTHSYLEVSMDIEWAHAIAPGAKLIVVEAPRSTWEDFTAAVDVAVASGATVVSLSLAEPQRPEHKEMYLRLNRHFQDTRASYVSAGGDHAHGARWPASSPDVVGVGGTTIRTDATGSRLAETAWSSHPSSKEDRDIGTGGGLSLAETEPPAQAAFGLPDNPHHMRGTPDVSYYAASRTELAVFDSTPNPKTGAVGWRPGGGTSAGTPQWAGILALANSMRAAQGKKPLARYEGEDGLHGTLAALYRVARETPSAFFDITEGQNGSCGPECKAAPGYDYLTGLGSPNASVLLQALATLP